MSKKSPKHPHGSTSAQRCGGVTRVLKTDAAGFHDLVDAADAVIIEFSREGVESGLIGDALDRLMLLTDSIQYLTRFESRVMFSFDGYNNDPREIYEIPECTRFFGKLTKAWPYWFHFITKDGDSVALLVLMMLAAKAQEAEDAGGMRESHVGPAGAIKGIYRNGALRGADLDPQALAAVVREGFDGMNALHEHMGVPEAINQKVSELLGQGLDAALSRWGI